MVCKEAVEVIQRPVQLVLQHMFDLLHILKASDESILEEIPSVAH